MKYPDGILEDLKSHVEKVLVLRATQIAEELGNVKAQNIVLLGSLIAFLGLDGIDWKDIITKNVPAKAAEINKQAFDKGYAFYKESVK